MTKQICTTLVVCAVVCVSVNAFAQRAIGARKLVLDNNAAKTVTLATATAPMTNSYELKLPAPGPPYPKSFLVSDENGQFKWLNENEALPDLPRGNIWVGNNLNRPAPLAPGVIGSFMVIDATGVPFWSTVLPPTITVSAAQITSGTLPPGTNIIVGNSSTITASGTGSIIANGLGGAGIGKFSGKIPIPTNANFMDVGYANIQAGSAVNVMVNDPNAQVFGYVSVQVESITPGVGFRVIFAAGYPPSGTGQLHWTVVDP